MCREREIDQNQVDNTANDPYDQLLEQLHDELNELLVTTAHLQEESVRLEREARQLINENIQVQLEARLLKEKYRHRRHSASTKKKRLSFSQLKQQLQRQRQSFRRFERRLRAKYEQPLQEIVSNSNMSRPQRHRCRRIRSIPSESID